jgi:hypothetical protein
VVELEKTNVSKTISVLVLRVPIRMRFGKRSLSCLYLSELNQPKKSVMVESSINTGHQSDFNNISVLDRASGYMDRLVKDAVEMRLRQGR